MSHTYGNGNPNLNTYLNRKRLEEDNELDNRYRYDKYDKFDKYSSHSRYTNSNIAYMHSRPPPGNGYYSCGSRFRNNYYNSQKSCHCNGYLNKLDGKRDYKKGYQKSNTTNANEGIRNLSHCEMPTLPPSQKKAQAKDESLNYISSSSSSSTVPINDTNSSPNNSIKIKDLNKLVSNITSRIQSAKNPPYQQHIFQNSQNINIKIHVTSPTSLKFTKDKQMNECQELTKSNVKEEEDKYCSVKIPRPPKITFIPFNRNTIKIEENPLISFEAYPKSLFDINLDLPKKVNSTSISESINMDNIENALSIRSSYLLAKIPNWRLVTNFVPASSLTKEKFSNIIHLDEEEEEHKTMRGNSLDKKCMTRKSHIVYYGKYEDLVEKSLEANKLMKKKIGTDIYNIKLIIEQYHYDILKIKNKIKQNNFKTNILTIKEKSLNDAIDENLK